MEQATMIGLDIAKHVFQVHGADGAGHVLFRKRITRVRLLGFLAAHAKRLDLLTQAAPHITRIILLYDVASLDQRDAATRAASGLGIPIQAIERHSPPYDYEQALAGTDGARGDALMVTSSPFGPGAAAAAEAALRHRLPYI